MKVRHLFRQKARKYAHTFVEVEERFHVICKIVCSAAALRRRRCLFSRNCVSCDNDLAMAIPGQNIHELLIQKPWKTDAGPVSRPGIYDKGTPLRLCQFIRGLPMTTHVLRANEVWCTQRLLSFVPLLAVVFLC